jgi:NADH-quinone oxidoreductase subunit L
MGGLRKYMPKTFATFGIATIAIMGIPPFSGFFSKDEILWQAYSSEHGHPALWSVGVLTAGITAFYMSRLMFLTFFGENRRRQAVREAHHPEHETHGHHDAHRIKESPRAITLPLQILAFFSIIAGFINVPAALGGANRFAEYLGPIFGHHAGQVEHNSMEYILMMASIGAVLLGSGLAYVFYIKKPDLPRILAEKLKHPYTLVYNKYYVDEIYAFLFISGTIVLSKVLAFFDKYAVDLIVNLSGLALRTQSRITGWFDATFVDGTVNFVADSTLVVGDNVRKIQTGRVQVYILVLVLIMALGIAVKTILA